MTASTMGSSSTHERVSSRTLILYSLPVLGMAAMFWLVMLYLLKYSTDVLGLAPALVGGLFALGRIWDAVSDPMAGYLSDRTRSRWGRRRPWFAAAALPIGAGFIALWTVPRGLDPTVAGLWLGVALLFFYTAQTIFNVPHAALGAELSEDHHERTRVFATRANFENLGMFLGIGALAIVENAAQPRAAMAWTSLAMAVPAALLMLIPAVWLRERRAYQGRGATRPWRAARDVWRNVHARRLFPVLMFSEMGFGCMVVALPFVAEHILGMPGLTSLFLVAAMVPLALSIPVWAKLSRRIGKQRAWLIGSSLSALGFFGLFFIEVGDWLTIALASVWIGATSGASRALSASVKADIIDVDELRTGERKEGAYFAAWNLSLKAAGGLAVAIAGFVLQFSGYAAGAPVEDGDPMGLRWLLAVLPGLFMGTASLLLAGLRLDEAQHRSVRERLSQRAKPALTDPILISHAEG